MHPKYIRCMLFNGAIQQDGCSSPTLHKNSAIGLALRSMDIYGPVNQRLVKIKDKKDGWLTAMPTFAAKLSEANVAVHS